MGIKVNIINAEEFRLKYINTSIVLNVFEKLLINFFLKKLKKNLSRGKTKVEISDFIITESMRRLFEVHGYHIWEIRLGMTGLDVETETWISVCKSDMESIPKIEPEKEMEDF